MRCIRDMRDAAHSRTQLQLHPRNMIRQELEYGDRSVAARLLRNIGSAESMKGS